MHAILNLCVCTNWIWQVFRQVFLFQLSCRFLDWRGCWSSFSSSLSLKPSKGIVPRYSTWKLHYGSSRKTNISLLLFLPQNQLFYLVTLFIALILFRSIILKVISKYIYPLKSHSLDPAFKRFHKLSRSSFREIVLFCMQF